MPEYGIESLPGARVERGPWRRVRMYDVDVANGQCTPSTDMIVFGAAFVATGETSAVRQHEGVELYAFVGDNGATPLHVSLVAFPRSIAELLRQPDARVVSLFHTPSSGKQFLQVHTRDSAIQIRLSVPIDFQAGQGMLSQRDAAVVHEMALPARSAHFFEHRGVVIQHVGGGKLHMHYPLPGTPTPMRAYETTIPAGGSDLVVHHENTDHRPHETLFSCPGNDCVLVALENVEHGVDARAPVRWRPTQVGCAMPATFFRVPRLATLIEFGTTPGEFAEHALPSPAPDFAMHIGASADLRYLAVIDADWAAPDGRTYACPAEFAPGVVPVGGIPVNQVRLRVSMYARPDRGEAYAKSWAVIVPLADPVLADKLPGSLRVVDAVPAADGMSVTLWIGTFAERMLMTISRRDHQASVNSDGSFCGMCATPLGADTPATAHALYTSRHTPHEVRDLRPAFHGRSVPEFLLFPHPVYTDGNAATAVLGVHQCHQHGTRLLTCDVVRARAADDPLHFSSKFGDVATRAATVVSSPHAIALLTDTTAAVVYEKTPHWATLNASAV